MGFLSSSSALCQIQLEKHPSSMVAGRSSGKVKSLLALLEIKALPRVKGKAVIILSMFFFFFTHVFSCVLFLFKRKSKSSIHISCRRKKNSFWLNKLTSSVRFQLWNPPHLSCQPTIEIFFSRSQFSLDSTSCWLPLRVKREVRRLEQLLQGALKNHGRRLRRRRCSSCIQWLLQKR